MSRRFTAVFSAARRVAWTRRWLAGASRFGVWLVLRAARIADSSGLAVLDAPGTPISRMAANSDSTSVSCSSVSFRWPRAGSR